jgi:hypothetical protein
MRRELQEARVRQLTPRNLYNRNLLSLRYKTHLSRHLFSKQRLQRQELQQHRRQRRHNPPQPEHPLARFLLLISSLGRCKTLTCQQGQA